MAQGAEADAAVLQNHGYTVRWQRREPTIYTATVELNGETTKLEWVVDSDYRFFPTVPDEMFGFILHPVDLALNKCMAAANRREVRDLVDLITIHRTILPLGAVVWAAVEKAPGFSPEALIGEIRRNSLYSPADWKALVSQEPIDPNAVTAELCSALLEAETFVTAMPTEKAGLLFLKHGRVVQPDPASLDEYETHAGQRRGHWPANAEIISAMLEHYRKPQ